MAELVSIKQNKDFLKAYKKGKSYLSPLLVMYVRKNYLGVTRYGITATKKIGCAVKRNRCRRVIRESYRQLSKDLPDGLSLDFVFVARGRTATAKSGEVCSMMKKQLRQAGVFQ